MDPIENVTLPGYRCVHRVTGFIRRKNYQGGPVLTLAVAEWKREGFTDWHTCSDVVTLMRLADLLSDRHELPINPVKLYGPIGRMIELGRIKRTKPCPACGRPWEYERIPPPRVPLDIRCACCCQ